MPSLPRKNLSRLSRRTVRALALVVVPGAIDNPQMRTENWGAPTVPVEEIVDFIDDWVRFLPRLFRVLFPVGLFLLEMGAFVLGPSLVPFSLMSPERRQRYVNGWVHARSRIRRDLIKAVKGLCLLAYYSDSRVTARLGYSVEEHVELVSKERLVRHGDDLRRAV